jgi:hypothetical protein
MALEQKYRVKQSGCDKIKIVDCTGAYSSDNTAGYGAPNVASSAITQAVVQILLHGYVKPFIFTLNIENGIVQSATMTNPKDVVVVWELENTVFPFTKQAPFLIEAEKLGLGDFPDGLTVLNVELFDGTDYYTISEDYFFDCKVSCCVQQLALAASAACNCDSVEVKKFNKATSYLNMMRIHRDSSRYLEASEMLVKLQEICEGKCGC